MDKNRSVVQNKQFSLYQVFSFARNVVRHHRFLKFKPSMFKARITLLNEIRNALKGAISLDNLEKNVAKQ